MKTWIVWLCMGLALLPAVARAADDVSVEAQVDRTALAPGESLQLTVTIRNGRGSVDLERLDDFKVFPRGTSSSMQFINGQSSSEETHNYLLVPQRQGELTIPALRARVDGRDYQTQPIAVTVSSQPAPRSADNDREAWVTAEVSETRPVMGQPIAYTFSFYQGVRVTDATFQPPEFKGFSSKEIKERGSRRQIVNGREYVVTQIYYVLTPLAPGPQTIAPAVLQFGIVRAATRRRQSPFDDFFNDPFFQRQRVETKVLQSQPLEVTVQPLPPMTGPQLFSGLVGRFDLTATVEKRQLNVGDSATLAITIQGQGNIADAQAPPLNLPDTLKTYADAPEEKIQVNPAGYSGQKVFRTALVPVAPGELPLPPVQLTYYDTQQRAYRTLTAQLPTLQVAPAAEAAAAPITVSPGTDAVRKQQVAFTGRDILPPKEGLEALQTRRPLAWPLFLAWIGVPCLMYGLLAAGQRLRRRDMGPAARMRARAQQSLKAARATRNDAQALLTALYQALTAAIFARAGRSGEALTWREAEALLTGCGAEAGVAHEAAALLTDIESSKFSGAQLGAERQRDLLEKTSEMVARLGS